MRVAALGDAHLGRSYLSITDRATGVNRRELDFEESFTAAVQAALSEEPDVMVWLGDVFDHPRPTYRSFRVAQQALFQIRRAGVPLVVISGNHDTPRLPGTESPYSALADAFPEVHFATRLQYERIALPGLVIHAVPQMHTVQATLEALDLADRERSVDHVNLLLTHPRVPQVEPRYADVNEIEVDAGQLRSDLVLLGHYHVHTRVLAGAMWYAGSTDTFSFADDPDRPKGPVVLDTDTGRCRHIALTGQRRLETLPSVYALGLGPSELEDQVLQRASTLSGGTLARLYLDGVDPSAYRLLDMEAVREAASGALHLKIEPSFTGVSVDVELPDMDSMIGRWERFMTGQNLDPGIDHERIVSLGRDYLSQAVEQAS